MGEFSLRDYFTVEDKEVRRDGDGQSSGELALRRSVGLDKTPGEEIDEEVRIVREEHLRSAGRPIPGIVTRNVG